MDDDVKFSSILIDELFVECFVVVVVVVEIRLIASSALYIGHTYVHICIMYRRGGREYSDEKRSVGEKT